ncbi:MAG: hypothetical protein IPK24_19260 [Kineosporiaceae bacterium]|nr:hypothetical protein [Kineosporiaceae bacterium]
MAEEGSRIVDLGQGADPELTLGGVRFAVEPGGQVPVPIQVRNPGQIVESYRVDVVGLDPPWWQAVPGELRVYAGEQEEGTVVLCPPAGAVAGSAPLPFGVRVYSLVDPSRCVVAEADLEVGRVLDLQSSIVPMTGRARWRTTFRITFANWGNAPVHLVLKASDPDEQLGFALSQDAVVVPVGGRVMVRLQVRPRKPFLRGSPVRLPFRVSGEPAGSGRPLGTGRPTTTPGLPDPTRPVLEAAVDQRPVLSRGVMTAAVALLVPLLLLGTWLVRLPAVKGARQTDAAPGQVTRVTARGVSAQRVRVSWVPVDRATGYLVSPVDPTSGGLGQGQPVGGEATQIDVAVPEGSEQGCFTVQATRGSAAGGPADPVCATVLEASLTAPAGVTATANTDGTLTVAWQRQPKYDHRVLIDGLVNDDVVRPGSMMRTDVVPPRDTCVSVVVVAVSGDTVSAEDAPGASTCVQPVAVTTTPTTAPAPVPVPDGGSDTTPSVPNESTPFTPDPIPPSSTPPSEPITRTTGVLRPWVAHLGTAYPEEALARAVRDQIAASMPGATILLVTVDDLRVRTPYRSGTYLVVYNGFDTQQQAAAFCLSTTTAPTGLTCTPLATGFG